ncbi:MAG TPA: hypothetical protein VFC47_11340 [Caulobacteraceae bacterium]|nr:hypothetical protein [Caulobacteraceae bacterium]
MFDIRVYRPAGPVLKRFHESAAFFRLMAGPVGSGKTAGAGCAEMVLGAMIQNPMPDGVRRAKFGVLRDTYRNLYSQFIPSWFEWFPREVGAFVGSDDRPAMHTFPVDSPLGPLEIQVEMRALGTNTVEKTCRGWNLTGCFLDEADLMPEEVMSFLSGRVKRWPQVPYRVSKGVWGTFNKPDIDHWTYRWCEEDRPANFEFFDQEPGILPGGPPYQDNPAAENRERLDPDYYTLQADSNPEWYTTRMVRNRWGASVSGEVIYPNFRAERHVSPVELAPEPRAELILGLDGGGTPAAVIMGRDRAGRRIVYAEVVLVDPYDPKQRRLVTGVGPARFAVAIRDVITARFPTNRFRIGYGDPAAFYGADREFGEFSFMETVGQRLNIGVSPAPSNEIELRIGAVKGLMDDYSIGGQPGLMLNPSCAWLRRGFTADYKYEERDPKQEGKALKPRKTATSHVHDALQYAALGDVGRAGVTAGSAWDRQRPAQRGQYGSEVWRTIDEQERARPKDWGQRAGDGHGESYKNDFNPWRA